MFSQHKDLVVENGQHICFCRDKWPGNTLLEVAYPEIFQIANQPGAKIHQHRDGNSRNPNLRRNIQDLEMEELISLLGALHNATINSLETPHIRFISQKLSQET
uniref:Putative ovule protein n=1 Tax=Solanum chacoense TaxID=4108 RepID=A0A0V0HNS8_SOLCH